MRVFDLDLSNPSNYETYYVCVVVSDSETEEDAIRMLLKRRPELSRNEHGRITNGRESSSLTEITTPSVNVSAHSG